MEEQIGVLIEQGPADWQIVQQDERGEGEYFVGGEVEVRDAWTSGGALGVGGYGSGCCGWFGLAGCADRGGWDLEGYFGTHTGGRALSAGDAVADGGESGRGVVAARRYAALFGHRRFVGDCRAEQFGWIRARARTRILRSWECICLGIASSGRWRRIR